MILISNSMIDNVMNAVVIAINKYITLEGHMKQQGENLQNDSYEGTHQYLPKESNKIVYRLPKKQINIFQERSHGEKSSSLKLSNKQLEEKIHQIRTQQYNSARYLKSQDDEVNVENSSHNQHVSPQKHFLYIDHHNQQAVQQIFDPNAIRRSFRESLKNDSKQLQDRSKKYSVKNIKNSSSNYEDLEAYEKIQSNNRSKTLQNIRPQHNECDSIPRKERLIFVSPKRRRNTKNSGTGGHYSQINRYQSNGNVQKSSGNSNLRENIIKQKKSFKVEKIPRDYYLGTTNQKRQTIRKDTEINNNPSQISGKNNKKMKIVVKSNSNNKILYQGGKEIKSSKISHLKRPHIEINLVNLSKLNRLTDSEKVDHNVSSSARVSSVSSGEKQHFQWDSERIHHANEYSSCKKGLMKRSLSSEKRMKLAAKNRESLYKLNVFHNSILLREKPQQIEILSSIVKDLEKDRRGAQDREKVEMPMELGVNKMKISEKEQQSCLRQIKENELKALASSKRKKPSAMKAKMNNHGLSFNLQEVQPWVVEGNRSFYRQEAESRTIF